MHLALARLLAKPEITASIIGVSKLHQLDEAIAALDVYSDAREIKRSKSRINRI